jgi:6-phosphofructokinase 2
MMSVQGMTGMTAIATLTMSPAVDMFASSERFYNDSKTRCQINHRAPGGGGINVARNLRRLGLDVLAIFPAGGHHGDLLQQLLLDDGLPFQCISIINETTQNIALSEDCSGKALHLVFPGAVLQAVEWQACVDAIDALSPPPQILVISGSLPAPIPLTFFADVIHRCHQRGIQVVVDTSGPALRHALEAGVFFVKLNREDFSALGYAGPDTPQDRLIAMKKMVEDGWAEHLVLTLGPNGALLASREGELMHVTPPPVTVVSHAGAGDSFVSVMTCKLYQGYCVADAFRYGVAAAAAAISTPGNQLEDFDWLEQVHAGVTRRI